MTALPYPIVRLSKGKEISIRRRHHWIFSGAIAQKEDSLQNGDLVQLEDFRGNFLAVGYFQDGSIMVRIISFDAVLVDETFWKDRINQAFQLRQSLGFTKNEKTNVFRLVHGEGDGLPGLIIDYYNGTAVIQTHQIGMYKQLKNIVPALQVVIGNDLRAVYDKSAETLPKNSGVVNQLLWGEVADTKVIENGCVYEIDWETGQKTGFFIDQRDNRELLAKYSKGKKVLNAFCYTGGFSVSALKAGAEKVVSVDISEKAINLTLQNVSLNGAFEGQHQGMVADVTKFIREVETDFDIMVLDPPAFAKNMKARHNAVQAYKRLNAEAIKRIKSGGIIFTFSCSQVVDRQLFENTITAAALEIGRPVRVLHHLSQPADHPINIFHPETAYLKGLVIQVE